MLYTTYTMLLLYGIGNVWNAPTRVEVTAIATEDACKAIGKSMLPSYRDRGGDVKFWCIPVTKPVPTLPAITDDKVQR